MPELPDVAAFKTYLAATSLHQRVVHTSITDQRILRGASAQLIQRRLKDQTLEEAVRHGKVLGARCSGRGWLLLHFGMTGALKYYQANGDDPRHARLLIDFAGGRRLALISRRMLGWVSFVDSFSEFIKEQGLGPDALAAELDLESFLERTEGRRGAVKPLLMNQGFVAGIGNVYADEILFQAGLHPSVEIRELDQRQRRQLYRVLRRVLETAVDHQADVSTLPRSYLLSHRRGDGHCPRCGRALEKKTLYGRPTAFCPHDQPRR